MEAGTEYAKFRQYLCDNFRYKNGTKRPVTFNSIVSGFEGWEELSEPVLYRLVKDFNKGKPEIRQWNETQHRVYYLNIKHRVQ